MNKFLILIAALLFMVKVSEAQTEKGGQSLGVNVGFSTNKSTSHVSSPNNFINLTDTYKITSFSIGPNYSYFIADKLDIGANLTYQTVTTNLSDVGGMPSGPNEQKNNNFSGQIYLRKYFLYANKIGFRAGPYVGYASSTQKSTWDPSDAANDSKDVSHGINAGANLDLVYYPSTHLGVAATLANLEYSHFTEKNTYNFNMAVNNSKGNSFNANFINDGLTLSVFYVFGSH